ncbi:NADH dehydrogenase [ubiquinone] 1 alpha subcomplex assembly factor 2 [Sipha flava]|jgi:NADH dehydrogenase [ubiquinone] 1 alpha subcomplex assembly factor 2|uniref:NADH dehydrogenase [ubiquinone] 1 alpha subcomplex assembly factor 2 n=1 Tax=Sipha flava TaxID=143950 RepID=A0A2S2QNN8_9HEMI|nr:NADH dehydrogenase [ubiquinone] 1 alpha subcomplex assembly factor 2 [Sipha flava]
MPSERRLWKIVFNNFLKSFKPKEMEKPIGSDAQGNQYFETPADPQGGRRLPRRWFVPIDEEIGVPTPEWSQWLRGRRAEPPTNEEIIYNETIASMKKVNAENIAKKFEIPNSNNDGTEIQQNAKGFPDMSDKFERQPGQFKNKLK